MTKVKLVVELDLGDYAKYRNMKEDIDWFCKEVLGEDSKNYLYNEEIGDEVGTVKVLEVL